MVFKPDLLSNGIRETQKRQGKRERERQPVTTCTFWVMLLDMF